MQPVNPGAIFYNWINSLEQTEEMVWGCVREGHGAMHTAPRAKRLRGAQLKPAQAQVRKHREGRPWKKIMPAPSLCSFSLPSVGSWDGIRRRKDEGGSQEGRHMPLQAEMPVPAGHPVQSPSAARRQHCSPSGAPFPRHRCLAAPPTPKASLHTPLLLQMSYFSPSPFFVAFFHVSFYPAFQLLSSLLLPQLFIPSLP